eukprot:gene13530-28692_t
MYENIHLGYSDLVQSIILCTFIYIVFILARPYYHHDERSLSWVVSALSSCILSIFGGLHFFRFVIGLEDFSQETIYSDNPMARLLINFFMCVNIMDLVLGSQYYPNQLGFLTAYVHHVFYGLFMLNVMANMCTHGMLFCFFEEVPTLLVALGNLFPALRSDILFGILVLEDLYGCHCITRLLDVQMGNIDATTCSKRIGREKFVTSTEQWQQRDDDWLHDMTLHLMMNSLIGVILSFVPFRMKSRFLTDS